MRISMDGLPDTEYDLREAANKFLRRKQRRLGSNRDKDKNKRASGDDGDASSSKKKKSGKLVQKKLSEQ